MIYSALFLSLRFDHGNVRAYSHIANDDDRNKHSHLVPSPLSSFFITFCRMSTKWGEFQHAHEKLFKIPEKWYIRIASTCCTHSPGIIHLKEKQRVEKGEKWVNLSTVFECSAVAVGAWERWTNWKDLQPESGNLKIPKGENYLLKENNNVETRGSVIMTSHTFRLFHFISPHPSRPEKHPDNSCHISLCWYQRGQETGILILILQQSFQLCEKFKISPQNLSHFFSSTFHSVSVHLKLSFVPQCWLLFRSSGIPRYLTIFPAELEWFWRQREKRGVELRQEKF